MPGDKVVIGADINCSEKSTTRRQQSWKQFCENFDLQMTTASHPTFHHHNGMSDSTIDFFVYSKDLNLGGLVQHCTLDHPLNLSSHDPLITNLDIQLQDCDENSTKFSNSYTDFKRKKIVWDQTKLSKYQELSARAVSDAVNYWDT